MRENKKLLFSIIGVFLLIITTIGSTYAYYISSSTTNPIDNKTAKIELELDIDKLSDNANSPLIPIINDPSILTTAAKGYGNNGNTFDNTKSCIDKNGYTVCQIYKITIKNNGAEGININGGVTSLSGTDTPNISCTVMNSSTSVSSISNCLSNTSLANNVILNGNSSNEYYIMVYINDAKKTQNDSGSFNGTITFTSTKDVIEANFN